MRADSRLLTYVRDLSGRFRHREANKSARYLMRLRHQSAPLWLALALAIAPTSGVSADPHDHDAARLAVERGEIRPLADILATIRGKLPGDITGVEIERKAGRWRYEFRVVNDKGRLFEIYVDGHTAEIERIKEK